MYRATSPDTERASASPDSEERPELKDSAAKYEQERIQVLQQERVHVQKKTFTKWCNSFLEKVWLDSDLTRLYLTGWFCRTRSRPALRGISVNSLALQLSFYRL